MKGGWGQMLVGGVRPRRDLWPSPQSTEPRAHRSPEAVEPAVVDQEGLVKPPGSLLQFLVRSMLCVRYKVTSTNCPGLCPASC